MVAVVVVIVVVMVIVVVIVVAVMVEVFLLPMNDMALELVNLSLFWRFLP